MKTVLITAYAINPYKGSEDAMGWQMIRQAARHHRVIAATRKNNQTHIENYLQANNEDKLMQRIQFLYFDWPSWLLVWKKGPLLSMIYYYGWQLTLALWLLRKKPAADLVHNLNFHNDWTPSFLWLLGKPMIWGHVGHHNKIPRQYLLHIYGWKEYIKDRCLWFIKKLFWNLDPFLYICKKKAAAIICMNKDAVQALRLTDRFIVHPSVAAELPTRSESVVNDSFTVLSAGRFVPLKGFDLTVKSFASFYKMLTVEQQQKVKLVLTGSGPAEALLKKIVKEECIQHAVTFIKWVPRKDMQQLYSNASVFLYPSHEGAGMVVPEAMSYEVPVICLSNNGPGSLVPPESSLAITQNTYQNTIKALAGRLHYLFTSPQGMIWEKHLAAQRYTQLFQWNVRGEMLREVYQQASGNNTSSNTNALIYEKEKDLRYTPAQ